VIDRALARDGFSGVMAYSLREACWLAAQGVRDILMGYPTADRGALAALAANPVLVESITLMVDDAQQLGLIRSVTADAPLRVCLDVDASLRIGRLHLGVRRSPIRTPAEAAALAQVAGDHGLRVVGVMFYEAQVAGLPDTGPAVAWVKRRSLAELAQRRGAVVRAVRAALGRDLEIVNGGGSGSVAETAADPVVNEVTAGSGLYVPTLFDRYRSFTPRPAMWLALPVVRRPARRIVTVAGGGYPASGQAAASRLVRPVLPAGLQLLKGEGGGEVQTPLAGAAAAGLAVGGRVWFRHAKAGELCERFPELHLLEGDRLVGATPTYRGEGQAFG
jgi:D-serine deaminase-like pyridoxal phosphate-dependent protein